MSVLPLEREPADDRTGMRAGRLLARLCRALERAARRTREGTDEEAIHDLRVAIRRLASALSLWRDPLRERPSRKAVRRLRRLRRALGPARELEVHVNDLEARTGVRSLVQRLVIGDLVESLRRERTRARRDAVVAVRERRVRRIARNVRRASRDVEGGAEQASLLAERLARAAAQVRQAIASVPTLQDSEALHRARIAVRKWRYVLEASRREEGTPAGPPVSTLRSVQKALGTVQDRATLSARLEAHAVRLRARGQGANADALGPLLAELDAERREAAGSFQELAAVLIRPIAEKKTLDLESRDG